MTTKEIKDEIYLHRKLISSLEDAFESKLRGNLIEKILSADKNIQGLTFQTGYLDDEYCVLGIEKDEDNIHGLVVYQTWDSISETHFLYVDELSFSQLLEIFSDLEGL